MTWVYTHIQQGTDERVFKLTRGRVTASSLLTGLPVIMLTTAGARSGRKRTVPLLGLRIDGALVVIASNYGRDHHPAWYHNLVANPHGEVTEGGAERAFRAREVTGPEHAELFGHAVRHYPGFAVYERRAGPRRLPLLVLEDDIR